MAKTFDFREIDKASIEITLNDPEGTVLHVTTPPERLIEQLAASADELTKMNGNNIEKVRASYALNAELISCNLEGVTVTADDLRGKYNVKPIALAAFTAAYMEFINEIRNAKN